MSEFVLSQSAENEYLLKGDIDKLLKNRRSKMALSALSYTIGNGQLIITSDLQINDLSKKILLALKYTNDTIIYDSAVNSAINKFVEEEQKFKEFSLEALNIKNNNFSPTQFNEFTKSLKDNMKGRTLYKLQLLSAYHLAFSQNGCNFSVPGAGKTSIVYGAYTYLHNLPKSDKKHIDKILIISPLSAFLAWETEYKDCFNAEVDSQRISGGMPAKQRRAYFYTKASTITLVNYDSVASLVKEISYFLEHNKVMVVLDEAHKIKNTQGGVRATAIMSLAIKCSSRVVLTGTPAPNGYEDLYNLFHFIWPDRDVVNYSVGQLRDMTQGGNPDGVKRMISNIDPYFLRIRKKDLCLKPAIEHEPIEIQMSPSQERVYRFIESKFVKDVSERMRDIHSDLAKARMIRLMQAATNPELLKIPLSEFSEYQFDMTHLEKEDRELMDEILVDYSEDVPVKYQACGKLVQQIIDKGGKVIIWANFVGNIKSLQKYLKSIDINSELLYGATPVAKDSMDEDDDEYEFTREAIIKKFHNPDSDFKVIIANPFAVSESISLHKACHNAIYLERSFNCTHYLQSKDRIHRYGLSKDVDTHYYYLFSKDTIDSVISDRLSQKERRMMEIIEDSPIPLFVNATDEAADDIKAILSDYARRTSNNI